ncbi:MAG: xanthine dehydrogenase family protein molybdopterin-binding subunit, partial [Alphaproteobacteria bacterium]|nr:xanthine dehydrogenase family protein molybdopterin-binding subunit [Alphaproteobacteria bacterium]
MAPDGIGSPVRRKEDFRFLTGRGTYTDDLSRPRQLHAFILRSPHAHARLARLDAGRAKAASGVVAVFAGSDMASDGVGGIPCGWLVKNKDGSNMVEPPHPPLAVDRVRYAGDAVAVVIATSYAEARDAAELIEVAYEPLPAVPTVQAAIAPGAPLVWEQAGGNTCYDWAIGDEAATAAAFASAAKVARIELVNNRLIPNAMEPRAALGDFDRATGEHTLYTTSQNPHVIRLLMGAFVLHIPESRLRVVAPDVGGGFGSKIFHYAEEAIVTWAAGKLARPVKWTADRAESFLSDAHGRDHLSVAEMAMDKDGRFLGLRVKTVANMGAYLSTFAPCVPTYLYATLLSGQYDIANIQCNVKAVYTNTVPVDAYRGAGRPEACYLIERMMETAAREMGMNPADLRRKNFITAFPHQTPVIMTYDAGDFDGNLDKALKAADVAGFPARKAEAARRGKLRGLGYSCYIEACGIAPSAAVGSLGAGVGLWESAEVRVNPVGTIEVLTGSHSHGQGHETTFAQVVADRFGLP